MRHSRLLPIIVLPGLISCTTVSVTQQSANVPVATSVAASGAPSARPPPRVSPSVRRAIVQREIAAADFGSEPVFHRTYTGTVPMLGHDLALPAGDWTLLAVFKQVHAGRPPRLAAVFLRHEATTLTGLFEISGNRQPEAPGSFLPLDGICLSSDALWSDVRAAAPDGSDADCAAVSLQEPPLWSTDRNAYFRALARGLILADVALPAKLVTAGVAANNGTDALYEQLWLNPDTAGIPPDNEINPARSAWASFNLAHDPAKAAFVERVKRWVASLRLTVRAELEGRTPVPLPKDPDE